MVPKSLQAQTCVCTNTTCTHMHTHTKETCSWHNPLVFFEREVVSNTARIPGWRWNHADNEICVPGKSRKVSQRHRRQRDPHPPFRQEKCSMETATQREPRRLTRTATPARTSSCQHPHSPLPSSPRPPTSSSFVHLTQTAWPTFHYTRDKPPSYSLKPVTSKAKTDSRNKRVRIGVGAESGKQ